MTRRQNRQALSLPTGEQIRTKADYQLACHRRNSRFQQSVLEFHRKYPPVWVPRAEVPRKIRWPRGWQVPVRARDGSSNSVLIGALKTLEDLEVLEGFAVASVLAHGYRHLRPESGEEYFAALGVSSPQEWDADFEKLAASWPTVPRSCLRWPWTPLRVRPEVLSPDQSVPAGVIAFVPIYSDTTEAELMAAGRKALNLRRLLGGNGPARQRDHSSKWVVRLRVFDAYSRSRNYRAVAEELGLSESTAHGLYAQAYLDIEGSPLKGTSKERRVAGIDRAQFESCPRCFTDPKERFCPAHRAAGEAYLSQDHVARPSASTLKAFRAHSGGLA